MELSSSATTVYKVVFPAIWLGCFGVASVVVAMGVGNPPAPIGFRVFFLVGWLLGLGVCAWICFPLKHVSLYESGFVVRGLHKEILLPFSEIEAVRGSSFTNPEIITLKLKRPSAFGNRIRFMPSMRLWRWSDHPTLLMIAKMLESRRG